MITQAKIYKVLHEHRSPMKLYGHDDGHLWDLAGEIERTNDHRLRQVAERLINDKL